MRETLAYSIDISTPVYFSRTGKAQAPSKDWMHPSAELTDYELIIVTRNTLYLQYDEKKYTVTAGEYLLLEPLPPVGGQKKLRKGFQQSDCTFYWLHFRCSNISRRNALLPDLINDGFDNILIPVQGRLSRPEQTSLMLIRLQDSIKNGYGSYYLNLLSTLILCDISNQHILQTSQKKKNERSVSEKIYNEVKDYVAYYINKNIKVTDIAEHFHYNEKYLSALFKKYSGYTLKEYIQQQKMEQADFLLLNSNLSVKEIAEHLGFSSYHTFEACYKKHSDLSPTKYRNLFASRITNYG